MNPSLPSQGRESHLERLPLSILLIYIIQHVQVQLGELGGLVGLDEVAFEGDDGGGEVAGVVADEAQGGLGVEGVGGEFEHVVAPVAEAVGGEDLPREERPGVGFAAGGDVLVTDEIARRYIIRLFEVR